MTTEYISEDVRKKAEKTLFKRAGNKHEDINILLEIYSNTTIPEYIRKEAKAASQRKKAK